MLPLNMAIVSINRIFTTQDRAVLEWEYDNVINRLAFGNIESDPEMIDLYQGFMSLSVIPTDNMQATTRISKDESSTTVGAEAGGQSENKGIMTRLSGWFKASFSYQEAHTLITQDPFLPLLGWCGNLSLSAVSSLGMSYYGCHAERERIHSELESEQWQMRREELEACNALQTKLLNSSWKLLRQYKLPDEYRLT